MGRFSASSLEEDTETSIDMSPLIDCVFILLIFFIVTTVFVEETGVEVDRPQAASASQLEKTSIMIAITKEGRVVYGGKEIGVNGVTQLVRRMTAKEDVPVIIQADKDVNAGLMVKVIGEAENAKDGLKVSISTVGTGGAR